VGSEVSNGAIVHLPFMSGIQTPHRARQLDANRWTPDVTSGADGIGHTSHVVRPPRVHTELVGSFANRSHLL